MKTILPSAPALTALASAMLIASGGQTAMAAGGTSTAQSIQFAITSAQNFVITGSETWSYDRSEAATYFDNTLQSGPTGPTCTGSSTNCALTNKPPAPNAPAPLANKVNQVLSQNKCTFFDGGALAEDTYTQDLTINGINGRGNWKFTWTYTVMPKVASVGQYTAWDVQSELNAAVVDVDGFMASQSTTLKSVANPWRLKASHSLMDTATNQPRLTQAKITLTDAASDAVVAEQELTYLTNYTVEPGDWEYAASTGTNGSPLKFGNAAQLFTGKVSDIHKGLVPSDGLPPPNKDDFTGNNNSLGQRAVFNLSNFASITEEGTYELNLSGNLKGNEGASNVSLSATENVTVSADGCR